MTIWISFGTSVTNWIVRKNVLFHAKQSFFFFSLFLFKDLIWFLLGRGLLWQSILTKFPPDFIYPRSLKLALFITTNQSYGVSPHQLMTLMGQILSKSNLTNVDRPHKLLQVVWTYLDNIEDAVHYLCCAQAWMPCLIQYWRVKILFLFHNMIHFYCVYSLDRIECSPKKSNGS